MIYVTAMPHRTVHEMRRTTFVCYTCRQTRNYMLSALMADAYAAASGSVPEKIGPEATLENSTGH
jgi:hypothetical protein